MKTLNSKLVSHLAATIPAILFGLLLTGCASSRWNLEFSAKTTDPVPFDVIGVNLTDKKGWEGDFQVADYWTNVNNSMRADAERLSFKVSSGKIQFVGSTIPGTISGTNAELTGLGTDKVILPRKSPVWKRWEENHVVGLVVICDPPGALVTPDRRKCILPLYQDVWDAEKNTLQIEIKNGFVNAATQKSLKYHKIKKRGWD